MTEQRSSSLWPWVMASLAVLWLLSGCGKTIMPDSTGGETHFLSSCDGGCDDGLTCVCGVCTVACEDDDACGPWGDGATCLDTAARSACGSSAPARVCDVACKQDADCGGLSGAFRCDDGACRAAATSAGDGDAPSSGDGDAPDGGVPNSTAGDGGPSSGRDEAAPLVMLLLDSSGSMERTPLCECETPSCSECLPDCESGERNRWTVLVEALSGRYQDYACEAMERTEESGATYDQGYYLPHYAVQGTNANDGLLAAYAERLRFGAATFDGWDTYLGVGPLVPFDAFDASQSEGEAGLWSYPSQAALSALPPRSDGIDPGLFHYPNCETDYRMNTGIRAATAADGPLVLPAQPADARATAAEIEDMLVGVRRYGGTPIAAALDDLSYLFWHDPALSEERAHAGRARHVVLITDGYPDDDYREFGCDCVQNQDPDAPGYCGGGVDNAPEHMRCPYPRAWEAAERLRCGDDGEGCEQGPVTAVHVVGLAIQQSEVRTALDRIAAAGGTGQALLAADGKGLRRALDGLFERLAR